MRLCKFPGIIEEFLPDQGEWSFLKNLTAKCFALMKTTISVDKIMREGTDVI